MVDLVIIDHSALYFMKHCIFWTQKHLVLMAKHDSGELRCPATALISYTCILIHFCFL